MTKKSPIFLNYLEQEGQEGHQKHHKTKSLEIYRAIRDGQKLYSSNSETATSESKFFG